MKNQGENNISDEFYEFIHDIADLIGPFIYLSFFSDQNISDPKREYN